MNNTFIREALFEHRFWLQILGDHGRFIYDALSPEEREKIDLAGYFIRTFDGLLHFSRRDLDSDQIYELTNQALAAAEEIRKFKLDMIKEHLTGEIKIELPPTFLNHMVNEVEEYLRILQCLLEGETPAAHPLHYHNLWLPDAAGHAGAVACRLDDVEEDLKMKSKNFTKGFHALHRKAEEFSGYTRTRLMDFPALERLNSQVETEIELFMRFLKDIEDLRLSKRALGTLQPLVPDHMYREECYYIFSLSRVSELNRPDCDPAMPRIRD